jgi:putative membrane protein
MWWDWDHWPMHHFFFFGPLFMIVLFAICMIMMLWMMRSHRHAGSSALDILNERYARGEIDRAEYEERRRVLRS